MPGDAPVVYLLHGEDEFALAHLVAEISAKVGDPSTASMNTTRMDGNTLSIEELRATAFAMPFLASRRLVVVSSPQARLSESKPQEKFKALLDQLPPTAALVLIEHRSLPENDWLLSWARQTGSRAFVRHCPLLKESDLAQWLQVQARQSGGTIAPSAAWLLARMVGPDTRLAYQELQKLLAYVNYSRAVEAEDVETLSIPVFHEKIFALVDALAEGNARKAPGLLRRFLEEEDPQYVFSMIVRQFRLLLMAREVLDEGGNEREVYTRLKLKHPRQAESLSAQARRFTVETLEGALRGLLEIDEAIKSGRIEVEVALESLAASFTAS